MRKILSAVLLLCASVCAYGQGATVLFPPAVTQQGNFLPFAKITFCTTPATLDTLGNCTNTISVFKDQGLTQPYSSSILTDGIGFFPPNAVTATSLWFSPAANLCFTLTTSSMISPATNPCTPFSVSVTPGSSPSFTNLTVTNTATITTEVAGQINKSIWVDGTKYPVTQAGIQQAFTDACAITGGPAPGTDVYLPPATVLLSSTVGQQFLVTCNLHIHGAGDYSTLLDVITGISSAIPIFRIKPDHISAQSDFLIEGVQITSDNANGGTALLFDGTNTGMSGPNNFVVRKNFIHGLAAGSWAIDTLGNATPGLSQMGWNLIENNSLNSGVHLGTPAVDSWLFLHNIFGSDVGGITPCVDGTTANNGASHITLLANNGGCNGGFFISHGTHECKILYNQIEIPNAGAGSVNGAAIDLIGDTFSIDQCEIRGNNLGQGGATIGIRPGVATGTIIKGNTIGVKPATGVGIALTASSSGTIMDASNTFVGTGGGAVAMSNASGANPFCVPLLNATGLLAAQLCNDSAGGFQILTNNSKSWDFQSNSNLVTPAGVGISYPGGSSGTIITVPPSVAGNNTITLPAQTGTLDTSVGAIDQTLTAAQTTTTLLAVTNAGQYLFSWNAKVMSVGTTSTLGPMTLTYTDPDGVTITTVVSATQAAGGITVSGAATNTTSTFLIGTPLMINVKAGTNVQVAFAYASTGSAMQYNLHEKLVAF